MYLCDVRSARFDVRRATYTANDWHPLSKFQENAVLWWCWCAKSFSWCVCVWWKASVNMWLWERVVFEWMDGWMERDTEKRVVWIACCVSGMKWVCLNSLIWLLFRINIFFLITILEVSLHYHYRADSLVKWSAVHCSGEWQAISCDSLSDGVNMEARPTNHFYH